MKAVIIGAGIEALHTIQKAHEYGLTVAALDGNPDAEGLKAADKALVVDISNEQETIEAVRKEQPDFVLTVPIGRYLTTIGAVNDALNLPGISCKMATFCTDKYLFHQKLQEQGLRKAHCYSVGAEESLMSGVLTDEFLLKFPAILKPRFGSGSRGIHMITDREQLQAALEAVQGEPYVLEECVAGDEYGVDGAVIQGNFHMVLLRYKENTPPPVRQAVGYFSVQPTDPFWSKVQKYMKEVVACLGLSECLLHADIIRSEDGPFLIELSARPSGHNLHNLFTPLCTGIDMAEEYIKYRMGKEYSFVPKETRSLMIHYFDMQGEVCHVPLREEIEELFKENLLLRWECHIKEGEKLQPVSDGHSVMGRGFFILKGNDQDAWAKQAKEIKSLFLKND